MMGITVDEPAYVFGDNQLVLANTTAPGSTLKKKSNAIGYHFVREGCACDEWWTTYINTDKNVADLLTKPLAGPKRTKFVQMLLHHYMWWRRGEDYDEFKGIRTSTCLSFKSKLTMFFLFFYDFPMGYDIWVLMISQCYPAGFGYIIYCCRMRKTLLIQFWCAIQVEKKFPHWLEGSVKRYSTSNMIALAIWLC